MKTPDMSYYWKKRKKRIKLKTFKFFILFLKLHFIDYSFQTFIFIAYTIKAWALKNPSLPPPLPILPPLFPKGKPLKAKFDVFYRNEKYILNPSDAAFGALQKERQQLKHWKLKGEGTFHNCCPSCRSQFIHIQWHYRIYSSCNSNGP